MADSEYTLDAVKATRVAAEDIDKIFRSSCIGMPFRGLVKMVKCLNC